ALEGADQSRDCESNDKEACRDPEPFPADPVLKAPPQPSQQSVHSSSRQGGDKLQAFSSDRGKRRPIAPHPMIHKAKTRRCAVLDKAGCSPPATRLSYSHMSQCRRFEPCIYFGFNR